jgi:hypothetical protein
MRDIRLRKRDSRRGSALLLAIIATFVLAGMAGAMLAVSGSKEKEQMADTASMKAFYAAEAGLNDTIAALRAGTASPIGGGNVLNFGGSSVTGTIVNNGDDTTTVTVFGSHNNTSRGVQAILESQSQNIFTTALFAGNSSEDPNYVMKFGGLGGQKDEIEGSVYSGGSVQISGDAEIDGNVYASGTVGGTPGGDVKTGVTQPIPDIAGMNYATNHDYDVAAIFSSGLATYSSSTYGGSAWQLPANNPCHIFRKNPSDRTTETSKTAKNDYFLEDPYETLKTGSTTAWSSGSKVTLTGLGGKSGPNSNEKVFYIDGNLWIHNKKFYSLSLYNAGPEAIKITFVVKGNIYISDNLFYESFDKDAVAMIAIKDDAVTDSGNIYFGDPAFGTLEYMDSFMYAENNFYDNNLSASGSTSVTVHGNMSAGNKVDIKRDYGSSHTKLKLIWDDRIATGSLAMNGIPTTPQGGGGTWNLLAWMEVPAK